ncbi:hypothetical protein ADL27_38645 [Streptomyces sp. NRRL F-6602]|nr:hypothetical protein ADL27_38645 [Streptomyces sp. NRRL F-6602]
MDDDLLQEFAEVHRLAVITDELEGVARRREFLLRRAAVQDRFARLYPTDASAAKVAGQFARALLAYDVEAGSSAGPLGAVDEAWADRPRLYVRQEYEAWTSDDA